jgi:hypothetical protein
MLLAQGGMPLGPEFRVNTYTTLTQSYPSVARDSSGNFVVVWESANQDGSYVGIFAQRYASTGAPLGAEFRVNDYTTLNQFRASVAVDAAGNFVVVWTSEGQDGSGLGIFGRRYAATGTPLGGEFRVNTYTTSNQGFPSVASDSAGNFVVAWVGYFNGIFAQRYASTGAPLGGEFRVNTYSTGIGQVSPSVASDSAGSFVVVWQRLLPLEGFSSKIFAQRYANNGAPLGGEFQITGSGLPEGYPSVASDSAGNFVVAWEVFVPLGTTRDVFAQRYANTGIPLGLAFRVNTDSANPAVASDAAGNFVVAWSSADGDSAGVFAQRYASTGTPLGAEFRVNSSTSHTQFAPSVASDSVGSFVVAWTSNHDVTDGYSVYAQRYNAILPVELLDFTVR